MSVGITFNERMDGFLAPCDTEPADESSFLAQQTLGKQEGAECRFEATMLMRDIAAYVRDPQHLAEMTGTFHWQPIGSVEMRQGEFQLYVKNPTTGMREMRYRFEFDGPDGRPLRFVGVKWMKPKARVNTWTPSTTLYSRIEEVESDGAGGKLWAGVLTIGVGETLKLFRSLRPVGETSRQEGLRAVLLFNRFFMREQLALLREG